MQSVNRSLKHRNLAEQATRFSCSWMSWIGRLVWDQAEKSVQLTFENFHIIRVNIPNSISGRRLKIFVPFTERDKFRALYSFTILSFDWSAVYSVTRSMYTIMSVDFYSFTRSMYTILPCDWPPVYSFAYNCSFYFYSQLHKKLFLFQYKPCALLFSLYLCCRGGNS